MPRAKAPNVANNRRDLLTPAAPGRAMETPDQAYGAVTGQEQSQDILPIGTPPVAAGAPAAGPTGPSGSALGPTAPPPSMRLEPGDAMKATLPTPMHEQAAQAMAQQMQGVSATGEQGTLRSVLTHLASQPQASSIVRALASAAGQ
jgi:hypothetical protein